MKPRSLRLPRLDLVDAPLKLRLALTAMDEAELKAQASRHIRTINGDIWEASLLYGQVEKKFKYDETRAPSQAEKRACVLLLCWGFP